MNKINKFQLNRIQAYKQRWNIDEIKSYCENKTKVEWNFCENKFKLRWWTKTELENWRNKFKKELQWNLITYHKI